MDFFSYILGLDVLIRIITTAAIVIIVTTSVGTFGPVVGGLLAGLPIALGPGFYFLLDTVSVKFLAQTATFSLLALSATQAFLLTYIMTARYGLQILSLVTSIAIWVFFSRWLKATSYDPTICIFTLCLYDLRDLFNRLPICDDKVSSAQKRRLLDACVACFYGWAYGGHRHYNGALTRW